MPGHNQRQEGNICLYRKEKMTRKDYVNVSIPKTLIEEIDEIIKEKKKGYTSRAELIKDSIRDKLEMIK